MKRIYFLHSVVDSLLSYSRNAYPNEGILLLRGKVKKEAIFLTEVVIPPLSSGGEDTAWFPLSLLPADSSIVGVAHSHPSGVVTPSTQDLNSFYGRMMVIIGYPFASASDMAVFDYKGNQARFTVI